MIETKHIDIIPDYCDTLQNSDTSFSSDSDEQIFEIELDDAKMITVKKYK